MTKDEFWDRLDKTGECWEWTGCVDGSGYGMTTIDGKHLKAHRAAWTITNGEIPPPHTGPQRMLVCHKCDNRRCCNPAHLFLGTNRDNVDDMMRKGRTARNPGTRNGQSKLNPLKVREIRYMHSTGKDCNTIARLFNLDPRTIEFVVTRVTWRHVS